MMGFRRTVTALGLALASFTGVWAHVSRAQDTTLRPTQPFVEAGTGDAAAEADSGAAGRAPASPEGLTVPACARDPKKLGLERIVEIDTAGGAIFGGSHGYNNFLNDHEVILTFDDGPLRPYTRPVLKALADHCTRATFFMVGRMAAADPTIGQGHHRGRPHRWLAHMVASEFEAARLLEKPAGIRAGLSAINAAAGRPIAPFFRFPYLSANKGLFTHLQKRDIATFFIDIDSKDFQTRDPEVVYQRILGQLASARKGIILMHDIQPSTAGMIRRLLDTLHEKNFKVVHIVPKCAGRQSRRVRRVRGNGACRKRREGQGRTSCRPLAGVDDGASAAPPGRSRRRGSKTVPGKPSATGQHRFSHHGARGARTRRRRRAAVDQADRGAEASRAGGETAGRTAAEDR